MVVNKIQSDQIDLSLLLQVVSTVMSFVTQRRIVPREKRRSIFIGWMVCLTGFDWTEYCVQSNVTSLVAPLYLHLLMMTTTPMKTTEKTTVEDVIISL
jgi:hypothetical protein